MKAILTETAISGCLAGPMLQVLQDEFAVKDARSDEVIAEILRVLEHDGYLRKTAGGYVYESKLLRDWWRKSHEEFYDRRK